VSGVIIAFDHGVPADVSSELLRRKMQGLFITDLTNIYERFWQKVPVFYIGDHWFLSSEGFSLTHNLVGLRLKRLFDLACALSLLSLTWPVMLLAKILINLESEGPAIYTQIRTGKDGKEFTIYKFRSMRVDAEKNGAVWAKENDNRITRIGKFIRLTRIDELPQLFNVLKGDMSFIGPRPERPEFNLKLEKDIPYYNLRHLVRPGLTGWAQVMYPYGASVEDSIQKLQFELYYIKNYSFFLDIKIILRTIKVVLLGKGR
jgi:exopolysaccharide biosynthesis polyprenyl glycosylphosphotransferase